MLYLAEVKNQTRGFVSGYKTDLKLLASQTLEQTWNVISGDEVISTDSVNEQTARGTLYVIKLDNNKQIQGIPELAGSRMVSYFKHFARTLEKSKSQEQEVEAWKESLKIQGEAIARRQAELDQQEQLLKEQQLEIERLEEDKNKLNAAWEQLREEQGRVNSNLSNQGEVEQKLQGFLSSLSKNRVNPQYLRQNCQQAITGVQAQQTKLDEYWQELEDTKKDFQEQYQRLEAQKEDLDKRRQELSASQASLQQAKIDLQTQQNILKEKEESLKKIHLYLQGVETLYQEVAFVNDDDDDSIDLEALETMSLGDLEEIVTHIQQETSKTVNFVNMQEEELTLQKDEVKEIEEKLNSASEVDKLTLETELADAQEAMRLLNETLVGQRRNLKKQQTILNQHINILSRRKGMIDVEFSETINLQPIIDEIESQKNLLTEDKDKINQEISHLRQGIQQISQNIAHIEQEYQQKEQQWETDNDNWQKFRLHVSQMEIRIDLLQSVLSPIQEKLNQIFESLRTMENSIHQLDESFHHQDQAIQDLQTIIQS